MPATCSGDVIDACEWHLAQLTLIQITISLASIVWDTQKGAAPLPESHCKGAARGNFLPAKYFNSIVLVWHIRGVGELQHTNQTAYPAMSRMKPWALDVYSWTYAFLQGAAGLFFQSNLSKLTTRKKEDTRLLTNCVSPFHYLHIIDESVFSVPGHFFQMSKV